MQCRYEVTVHTFTQVLKSVMRTVHAVCWSMDVVCQTAMLANVPLEIYLFSNICRWTRQILIKRHTEIGKLCILKRLSSQKSVKALAFAMIR